jgi:GDP-4-dehydro-6-deoxy-D-mannose reductase
MNGTIVITGGNGFVGKHLVKELANEWPEAKLVVWDRTINGLPEGVQGMEVDITESESYRLELTESQPKWIVHLAAIAPIPVAMKDPGLTRRVNVDATRDLLQLVREAAGDTRVLAISSSDIYGAIKYAVEGKAEGTPLPELGLDEAKPTNPYAASKLAMEEIIERDFNDLVIRARPFPHIGPGQGRGFVTADFASQIAAAENGGQEPIIRVGNLDTRRDFTDVRDVVRAYRLLMEKGQMGEVYHVASEKVVQIREVLEKLVSMTNIKLEIIQDQEKVRKSDVKVLAGSAKKLRDRTGWKSDLSLDRSLGDILSYWREVLNDENIQGND